MRRQVIDVSRWVGQRVAIDWCRDHYGIEPNRIPSDSVIVIDTDSRTVTYDEIEIGEDGLAIIGEGNDVKRATIVKHFEHPPIEWPT